MDDDPRAGLADRFADEAYASVKGVVRTYMMDRHLLEHLPPPPAAARVTSRTRWRRLGTR